MMPQLKQIQSENTTPQTTSNEEATKITSLEESHKLTQKEEIEVSSEIVTAKLVNEEQSEITSSEEQNKFLLHEKLSETTSQRVNEDLSEIASQRENEEPSEIRQSDEDLSCDSSDSGDVFDGLSEIGSDEDDPETADFGAEQVDQDLSDITSDQSAEDSSDVVSLEERVDELRQWVETEAEFYGRTDYEFLVMFVLGCKINMAKAKAKMTHYYQNRKKIPQWWANRNVNDFDNVLQKRMVVLLTDSDPNLPTLAVLRYGRLGGDSEAIDRMMAMFATAIDINLRRNNCQRNGALYVIDCLDYPLWLIPKMFNPFFLYNVAKSVVMAAPARIVGLHYINFPLIGHTIWKLCKPFWPKKIRDRFTFSSSDWTVLKDVVDVRLLPIEYGGTNGSLVDHEEAFIQEMHNFSDYLTDDNKYGFQ